MSESLSVVMPVYNEAGHLPATIDALVEAVERSAFDAELVLVDDGSRDGSADAVRRTLADRLTLRVVSQPNRGRLEARRAGLEAAQGEWVLLLDARVRLEPGALRFVHGRLDRGERVWTGHVYVTAEDMFGVFWRLLADLAWREYFDDPRTTSFGSEEFDRYPKGTGCFFAPRKSLAAAMTRFRSRYTDRRHANDDTPMLRSLAVVERIHVSPNFACSYTSRSTLPAFFRHSVHRGVVFLDGHGRTESRFFPAVVAFFPVSAVLALRSLRRPASAITTGLAISGAAAAFGVVRRRTRFEVGSLAVLAPVYALAHGIGMWRGLLTIVRDRTLGQR